MKKKKESYFWTSYSDLMTSLFFVILVIFVLSLVVVRKNNADLFKTTAILNETLLKLDSLESVVKSQSDTIKKLERSNKDLRNTERLYAATKMQLKKIEELNSSIEKIDANYFVYDSQYKRHTLKNIQVRFNRGSSNIYDLSKYDRDRLCAAGRAIRSFMLNAQNEIPDAEYLLIIEGQSSKDNYVQNDELSYQRALALEKYWSKQGINFDRLPCEVIISGSGQSSKFRVQPDNRNNVANQRFVIHIIPKPGVLGDGK